MATVYFSRIITCCLISNQGTNIYSIAKEDQEGDIFYLLVVTRKYSGKNIYSIHASKILKKTLVTITSLNRLIGFGKKPEFPGMTIYQVILYLCSILQI